MSDVAAALPVKFVLKLCQVLCLGRRDTNCIMLYLHVLLKLFLLYCLSSVHSLQEEYPQWFEKPVLEMVHHNTVSLDKLVEMAWVEILTKYAVGEECDFLVSLTFYISFSLFFY